MDDGLELVVRAALDLLQNARGFLGGVLGGGVATAVALISMRLMWRRDRRAERESVSKRMGHLIELQSKELGRFSNEGDAMRAQLNVLASGRLQLQDALDGIREQLIAARVMIHDYERRLGMPETAFPPLPLPTFFDRPAAQSKAALPGP